jgi:ATP-binding cassette subfamily E protein 1
LIENRLATAFSDPVFMTDIVKPLNIEALMDSQLKNLSGGEAQRVALIICLGISADIYLIDEPSAWLDAEQRLVVAKAIKRFILHTKKTAFIVEHDFIMATYLADRVIVYDGIPGKEATASSPLALIPGMNTFLSKLDVTFRRDPKNYRPRVNKWNGLQDREQKKSGQYFTMDL